MRKEREAQVISKTGEGQKDAAGGDRDEAPRLVVRVQDSLRAVPEAELVVDMPCPDGLTFEGCCAGTATRRRSSSPACGARRATAAAWCCAPPATSDLPWQRGLHVLVIDDSHFSREAVAVALVKIGFHVQTAESGDEGLKLASKRHYDVALVDFEMPGMKGPEVLRRLRALNEQAPSVLMMLTSRSGAVDRLRAKFAGCDAYLTKPTRMNEFLKKLREFAAEGRLSRS